MGFKAGFKAATKARSTGEFSGFRPATWRWFRGLEKDNSRDYFTANRATFDEHVKGQLEALLDRAAVEFGGRVKIFRQHRDIRFSPNKAPYKTNTYGVVMDRPASRAGLYVSIDKDGLHAATGYYEMAKDQLERYRAGVLDARRGPALARLVDALRDDTEVWGATLKTAPRGFDRNHERVELLRHTSLISSAKFAASDPDLADASVLDRVFAHWRRVGPLCAWLDEHVGDSDIPPETRFGR